VTFAEDISKDQAQAAEYFEALMAGDFVKLDALIDVPFSLDRKKTLTTKAEVDAVQKQIIQRKGKRAIPEYRIAKTDRAPKLDENVFSKYSTYRLTIEGKEVIDIYVSVGASPKVIGFTDY
jgi:hypothetical protein